MKKKLNRDEKPDRRIGEVQLFMRRYARRKRPGFDPNDRRYDKDTLRWVKQVSPDELYRLLRDDEAR